MLKAKKLHPNAKLPTKANKTDAGFDLYALDSNIVLSSNSCCDSNGTTVATKIKTGISLEIPEGYYGLILDRSSVGSKLIKTLGGVIDCGYRGDITVCLANLSNLSFSIASWFALAFSCFSFSRRKLTCLSLSLDKRSVSLLAKGSKRG